MKTWRAFWCCVLFVVMACLPVQAESLAEAGFRTLGIWEPSQPPALDTMPDAIAPVKEENPEEKSDKGKKGSKAKAQEKTNQKKRQPTEAGEVPSLLHPPQQTDKASAGLRLDVAVWYPAHRKPFSVEYGDWTFEAARGAAPMAGRHPLLVLSHDTSGSRFSLHQLAKSLAEAGFVVVAPTHPLDNLDAMTSLFTLEQLASRVRDVRATLDAVLADAQLKDIVDPQRIGVVGVGAGGSAALLLAGAQLDAAAWKGYCEEQDEPIENNVYCTPWARERMEFFAQAVRQSKPVYRDPRFRVAVAVAPQYSMFFTRQDLAGVTLPTLLVQVEEDRMSPEPWTTAALATRFPVSPALVVLKKSSPAALMSPCSERLSQTLPELCLSVKPARRERVQEQLAQATISFLLQHVGTPLSSSSAGAFSEAAVD